MRRILMLGGSEIVPRKQEWPELLAAYVDASRSTPFAYGKHDCCLWAAGWIVEATGDDPAAHWRGYASEAEAQAIIDAAGGLRGLVSLPERATTRLAQRGDVVLAEHEGRQLFGVVIGGGWYAAPGLRRLEFRPMTEALVAFEV
jgi:hypothetical protein